MRKTFAALILSGALLSGCAERAEEVSAEYSGTISPESNVLTVLPTPEPTQTPAQVQTQAQNQPQNQNEVRTQSARSVSAVLVTPATQLSQSRAQWYVPSGTYTRLVVTADTGSYDPDVDEPREPGPDQAVLPYATRSPLERFFVGTRHSVTLSVKATTGPFVATVPLLTLTHDSTRKGGEVFNRVIRHEARDFPIFLVRGDASSDVASLVFDLKGSDKVESSAAGTALSAVIAATNIVSPGAKLLTTLSAGTTKDTASAIDSTINQLFAKSLAEQQLIDKPIRLWRPVTLQLYLPRREGKWQGPPGPDGSRPRAVFSALDYVPVGTWTVRFDEPRVSAFSAQVLACVALPDSGSPTFKDSDTACATEMTAAIAAARAEVEKHYGDVLAFPLIKDGNGLGTIASYLKQLDWWTPAVNSLDVAASAAANAAHFCRQIRDALTGIGLNDLDARFGAAAVQGSALVSGAGAAAMGASAECKPL